jgi:RNA polymerase sigma-70 factor (ECF subfamily)
LTSSPADADLAAALRAAQDGDAKGFATLWRAMQPGVLRYLRVVVGDRAEDAASETWLQVIRDLHRFHGGPADFRGWLFRIARHRGIDEQRRRAATPTADPGGGTAPDAATQALEDNATTRALGLVGTLPPDQAEAVMLRVVAGLDVATTARILGKRPGAVRIATMRGLRRLATNPQINQLLAREEV